MKQDFLKGLNSSQVEAVTHGEGPMLVLAGPGSGKTRVITHRVAYLIKNIGISPWKILAVTFTNKAAREMKKRVGDLAGENAKKVWLGTFHATCLKILKREIDFLSGYTGDFVIYDRRDQLSFIKKCLRELDYGVGFVSPESALNMFDAAENSAEISFGDTFFGREMEKLYAFYKKELVKGNAMTFNDLLLITNRLFRENPEVLFRYQERFSHILVDEYQDTNVHQYRFVKALSDQSRNLFVVGDENQSIYGWRGAEIRNILDFEKDFEETKVVKLERSYRSTKTVLEIANGIISQNFQSKEKNLWTENSSGDKAIVFRAEDDAHEAKSVAGKISNLVGSEEFTWSGMAILYRANFQSRIMEEELMVRGIPYMMVSGVGFYQRTEIKDLLAYLRLVQNPEDSISFERIINIPPRGIGKVTVEQLREIAQVRGLGPMATVEICLKERLLRNDALSKLAKFSDLISGLRHTARNSSARTVIEKLFDLTSYVDYLGNDVSKVENIMELLNAATEGEPPLSEFLDGLSLATDEDRTSPSGEKVSLMTIHAAKGLEFPAVFVIGVNEGLLPHERSSDTIEGIEEERRLFYVAVTRSQKFLCISYFSRRKNGGRPVIKSPFLDTLPSEHVVYLPRRSTPPSEFPLSFSPELPVKTETADSGFFPGQAVSHLQFGKGVVKKVETSGKNIVVTAVFPDYGARKIISDFLSR